MSPSSSFSFSLSLSLHVLSLYCTLTCTLSLSLSLPSLSLSLSLATNLFKITQAQGSEIELKNELEEKQQQLNIANFDRETIIKKMDETEKIMNELNLKFQNENNNKNQIIQNMKNLKKEHVRDRKEKKKKREIKKFYRQLFPIVLDILFELDL